MGLKVKYDDNKLFGYGNTDDDEKFRDERDEYNQPQTGDLDKENPNGIVVNGKKYDISFDKD